MGLDVGPGFQPLPHVVEIAGHIVLLVGTIIDVGEHAPLTDDPGQVFRVLGPSAAPFGLVNLIEFVQGPLVSEEIEAILEVTVGV